MPSKLSTSSLQILVLDPTRPNPLEQLNVATVWKTKLPPSVGRVLYSTTPLAGAVTGKQAMTVQQKIIAPYSCLCSVAVNYHSPHVMLFSNVCKVFLHIE